MSRIVAIAGHLNRFMIPKFVLQRLEDVNKGIAALLPEPAKAPLRLVRLWLKTLPYYGTGRHCPVCGKASNRFRPDWNTQAQEAICIHCGARERHRFVWLYFNRWTDLFNGQPKCVLHVAPEPCFEPRMRKLLGEGYITSDLTNPLAMSRMDITSIDYPDGTFDVIYCSHVLEHVPEDRRAMKEFYRVLKKGGWAILLVPISGETTLEDLSIVDPLERLRLYGEKDHVRCYGLDFMDRLKDAGFLVTLTRVSDVVNRDEVTLMGLTQESGDIFYCTKQ